MAQSNLPLYFTQASQHSYYNFDEVMKSQYAGCYYCKRSFPTCLIDEDKHCIATTPHGTQEPTVFCPFCGIDAVIGDASGHEVTNIKFLNDMHHHNFKK